MFKGLFIVLAAIGIYLICGMFHVPALPTGMFMAACAMLGAWKL